MYYIKKINLKRVILFIFLIFFLNGCFKTPLKTGEISEKYKINLSSLAIGMPQQQVLDTMGRPYETEKTTSQNKIYEVWNYLTEPTSLDQPKLITRNFTPLVFEAGHLVGWGKNFYKYDDDKRKWQKNNQAFMEITIIGTGYVGLVTGACFAEMGHIVTCLDIDEKKIKILNESHIPIYEPNLEELVKKNIKQKRLFFTTDYKKALKNALVCFICVPTPSRDDGSCNTTFIENVAKIIGNLIDNYKIIVTKSTAEVGSTYRVKNIILEELTQRDLKVDFDVVSNPEFLKEGTAVSDCLKPDRIVIGTENEKSAEIMKELYREFTLRDDRLIFMDIVSSEMTKYAANAMLATRISFMNEMANICEKIGANINNIRKGIGSDSRIGHSFLYAGIGYGGSCFPKDIKAICHLAKQKGVKASLLEKVDEINTNQKKVLAKNIIKFFSKNGGIKDKTIAIWGLSFKPNTDDMRDAPSLVFIEKLLKKEAKLRLFDPIAMQNAKKIIKENKNIIWCKDENHAAEGSDAIALLTEWEQFRLLNFNQIKKTMKKPILFDGRNHYNPLDMEKKGFKYIGIGTPHEIEN